MPLNLATNHGDFVPFIKYDARAGRWFVREEGKEQDTEVRDPELTFDFANIKTGWIAFAEGQGPQKVFDPSLTEAAPKPEGSSKWKRGFEVVVHGRPPIGKREFCSTAGVAIEAIQGIYAIYEAQAAANAGKLPVFRYTGVNPVSGQKSTNYAPVFELVGWVDAATIAAPAPARRQSAPPANGGMTGAQVWAAYRAQYPGKTDAEARAALASLADAYFGTVDRKSILPAAWAKFVADGFQAVGDNYEIPF